MTTRTTGGPRPGPDAAEATRVPPDVALDECEQDLEEAAQAAMLAPSVHGSTPWTVVLHADRLELRADRGRQLTALDPSGREMVQSIGAALFNVRVALAARGWAVEVDRFPRPDDPDLVAEVRPVPGAPEARLPLLAPALRRRHTHRLGFLAEEVPDELVQHLTTAAATEDVDLTVLMSEEHRRRVADLVREADAVLNGDPRCRADLLRWWSRPPAPQDEAPLPAPEIPTFRPSDRRTVDSDSGEDRTFVLLTSRSDDPGAWLRSGEALERVLLELTHLGWAVSPMTQALEVPLTRTQLRAAVTRESYPQMLLRVGFPAAAPGSAREARDRQARAHGTGRARADDVARHPVSDGRGGTTWR